MSKPELVSFKLCPFVQRAVIMLLEKQVDYDVTFIDLSDPPEWFHQISPLGKVPLLKTEGEVLFESAVICEYLDEVHPPALHPENPLRKAHNRAWIEFGGELLFAQFRFFTAQDAETQASEREDVIHKLGMLESQLGAGPFFNGEAFSVVDAALAPILLRFDLLKDHLDPNPLADFPRLRDWQQHLLARPSVQQSIVDNFAQIYQGFLRNKQSLLLSA